MTAPLVDAKPAAIDSALFRSGVALVVVVLVILSVVWHARHMVSGGWRDARGYELEEIAEPLSKGHGYTFAHSEGWLGPYDNPAPPTAWVEPVQTGVMAIAFWAFGERGRMVLVLLNYVWFAACCFLVFDIGRRLGSVTGGAVAAVALAAFNPGMYELRYYIGNTALAAALICLVTSLLLAMFELTSWRRCAVLGLVLGVLSLTHVGTMLFVPFAGLLAVIAVRKGTVRHRWAHGAVVVGVAALVVLPWTIRNYGVFGEFVPVRTGLGQNMIYALPGLAQTIQPDIDLGAAWSPPPWTVSSPREAMSRILSVDRWKELNDHSMAAGRSAGPADYSRLNEAERDAVHRDQSFAFIRNHPSFAARLTAAKADGFFWSNWPAFRPVTILAILGGMLLLVMRRRGVWIIGGLVVLYTVPYMLSAPIYYRYRAPIESLFFVLGGMLIGTCADALRVRASAR